MGISYVNRGPRTSLEAEMLQGTISGGDISFSRKTEHTEEENKKEKESKKEKQIKTITTVSKKVNVVDLFYTFLRYIFFYLINIRVYIYKKVLGLGESLGTQSSLDLGTWTLCQVYPYDVASIKHVDCEYSQGLFLRRAFIQSKNYYCSCGLKVPTDLINQARN